MTEIQTQLSTLIAEHEETLKKPAVNDNASAFHRGQIRKLSQARQFVKDAIMAEERYNQTAQEVSPAENHQS